MWLSKISLIKHQEWSKDVRNIFFSQDIDRLTTIRGMKTQTTMAQIVSHFSENGIYLKKTKDYQMKKEDIQKITFVQDF